MTPVFVQRVVCALVLAWGSVGVAQAAIYTCVDAQGRRITSDRPIAACMDREQRARIYRAAGARQEQLHIEWLAHARPPM